MLDRSNAYHSGMLRIDFQSGSLNCSGKETIHAQRRSHYAAINSENAITEKLKSYAAFSKYLRFVERELCDFREKTYRSN